jgi:flagellar biosynthesis component FlhA
MQLAATFNYLKQKKFDILSSLGTPILVMAILAMVILPMPAFFVGCFIFI